jgi:hypothetical protein
MPSIALNSLADDLGDLDLATPQGSSPAAPALTMPALETDMSDLALEKPSTTARKVSPPSHPPAYENAADTLREPPPVFVNPAATVPGAGPAEQRAPGRTHPPAIANPAATVRGGLPSERSPGPIPDPTPPAVRGKIKYAVLSASLTSAGIHAQREDGSAKLVEWESIIGIIARRLPPDAPFHSTTFVDVISTRGSTLRILPWTQITGAPIFGQGEERARAFVQLVAAHCLDAKLDSWTKVFADGAGHAAQLPNVKMLAGHDEHLA